MGVRLIKYNRPITGNIGDSAAQGSDHDELINRDLLNQHPIYAITGLQEVLNLLEDSIQDLSQLVVSNKNNSQQQISNNANEIQALKNRVQATESAIARFRAMQYWSSESINLSYNATVPALSANVKLWTPKPGKPNTNAIQCLASGLYAPKFISKDSPSIIWSEIIKGESLNEIFVEGLRFSHTTGNWSDHVYPSCETSWYWDDNLQSFVQPENTGYFNGFITKDSYDNYTHTCTIKSTNADDDLNGLVIGYIVDGNGLSHTLTVVCDRGGLGGNMFAIWYNYNHVNEQRIAYKSLNNSGGWDTVSNGILFEAKKNKNIVSVCCSQFNSIALDESMRLDIDLNNYSWGHLFSGPVQYGYCNYSQAYSFYQNVQFASTYVATSAEIRASVNLSKDPTNALQIRDDGLYSEVFRVSNAANNALTRRPDGYWVETHTISPDAYNALQKRQNGYYVEGIRVSTAGDNSLQRLSDGSLYVRDYRNMKYVYQSNHGFIVGDFIYYHPTCVYLKAKALDNYDVNIVGMVTRVIDANQFEYQWTGFFSTPIFSSGYGYTQGAPLYISDVNPGKVTQDQPEISKTVGYPVENNGIIICIERGIQYNQEASIGDFKVSANTYNVRSDGFIRVAEGVSYKQSLVQKLINTMSNDFKNNYMTFDNINGLMGFKNTSELYTSNSVRNGENLFIKAF